VVDKTINFQNAPVQTVAILQYSINQRFHLSIFV